MNKVALSIISAGFIIALVIIFSSGAKIDNVNTGPAGQNIEIRDGVQYITINARGGYFPRVSTAKAGIPTKLIVKTSGTYDCSAALRINSIGFRQILPQTGDTEIDIGTPKAGEPLQGICAMGMYYFSVNFN